MATHLTTQDDFITKLRAGDQQAFQSFYTEYFPYFLSFTRSYLVSEFQSRDVVQEIFTVYWQKRENFDDLVSLKVFFYRSLRNRCLNILKSRKYHPVDQLTSIADLESMDHLEESVIREEVNMAVRDQIDKLSPQVRKILRLSVKGFNNQQIADQLDISINTVKAHKKTAYQILRENLKDLKLILQLLSIG